MAIRSWTDGGADGDWQNTANWSGGAVPTNGDTAYIDVSARNITGNLDQSAIDLARLEIGPGFTGKIGTSANYLKIGVNGPVIINGGAASPDAIWLNGTTADLQSVHVLRVGDGATNGTIHFQGATTTLYAIGGNIVLESGTVGTLWIEGESGSNDSVKVTNVAATVTTTHHFAGRTLAEDGATGTWTTYNNYSSAGGSPNVEIGDGTLVTYNGYNATALVRWSAGAATITSLNNYSGIFRATGAGQTVTNCTAHNAAVVDASAGSVTFTNPVTRFADAQVIGSPGKTIQFA